MTLQTKLAALPGRSATPDEIARLRDIAPALPDDVIDLLATQPIIGVSFSLTEEKDYSDMGVELRVLGPDEILDEAKHAYPGITALPAGFVPVAACLEGSGDPYFVSISSGELVRIPHGAVSEDGELDAAQIEVVRESLADFLELAEPYPS